MPLSESPAGQEPLRTVRVQVTICCQCQALRDTNMCGLKARDTDEAQSRGEGRAA